MSIQRYQLEPDDSSSEEGEEEQIDSREEEVFPLDGSLDGPVLVWMWEMCDAKWSWMCLLQRTSFFVTTSGRFVDSDVIYIFYFTFGFLKAC